MTMQNTLTANHATCLGNGYYSISNDNSKNPWTIDIFQDAKHPETGTVWKWKIDTQYFSKDEWAANYLTRLIAEKKTGIRIINREPGNVPDLCGNGRGSCSAKTRGYFTMLCSHCPVAEQMQADQDGVALVYQLV